MAIDILQTVEIIEVMENFLFKIKPPEHIRPKLDFGYKIEGQSIILFAIRPQWKNPETMIEYPFAKATFVKSKNHWKVFWMRSDLQWHQYTASPTVQDLRSFSKLVKEDKHQLFFG